MPYSSLLCPEALPTERALCQHLMWSDQVKLMWPITEPKGFTKQQADMLTILEELREARGSSDRPLVEVVHPSQQTIEAAKPLLDGWQSDQAKHPSKSDPSTRRLEQGTAIDSPPVELSAPEVENYLWASKFPPEVLEPYIQRGLLESIDDDERGPHLRATKQARGLVPYLLTALAGATALDHGRNTSLVFTNNQVLRAAVIAKSEKHAVLGTMLSLPALPIVRPDITVAEIRDRLTDDHFIRARAEYLQGIAELKERTTGAAQELEDLDEYFAAYAKVMEQTHRHVSSLMVRLKDLVKRVIDNTTAENVVSLITDTTTLAASPSAKAAFDASISACDYALQIAPVILDWRGPQFLRYARAYVQPT